MQLALELGMTEQEMLGRMDAKEFGKWQAYFRIFPFKEERADFRAAMLAANASNSARGPKTKPFRIKDFLFDFVNAKKKQTPEQMKNMVRLFAKVHNKSKAGQ